VLENLFGTTDGFCLTKIQLNTFLLTGNPQWVNDLKLVFLACFALQNEWVIKPGFAKFRQLGFFF
jgi:hypothetical protein